ncbi:(2Fe-2S)-binding protein [Aquabacterium humicola]|uniref:(2Fe-2S)-binding protein n=1 Tax=Aquabacterium humicola TaxID=3237377 RepID=UPI002543F9BD|nr:(2Fe-2S)-binding protein [Rubrivivax pictus]
MRLTVNGRATEVDADPAQPLLWVLRETLGLPGTKYGCGIALCGACTVHVDGRAARACALPVGSLAGMNVTTIEGLATGEKLHVVQQAWIDEDVAQCGYCQAGMIMAAADLLAREPRPSDAQIDAAIGNLCRCGTQMRVRRAIHRAAALAAGGRA